MTNITLPTGEVSGFHGNLERWSRVEVEASNRENFVTSTNLSASDTIYTFRQGKASGARCVFFSLLIGQLITINLNPQTTLLMTHLVGREMKA